MKTEKVKIPKEKLDYWFSNQAPVVERYSVFDVLGPQSSWPMTLDGHYFLVEGCPSAAPQGKRIGHSGSDLAQSNHLSSVVN